MSFPVTWGMICRMEWVCRGFVKIERVTYVQVPTKTVSVFAPISDINTAKASTKTNINIEVCFLLIFVRNNRKTGISRMMMTRQIAIIWATSEIFTLEKR